MKEAMGDTTAESTAPTNRSVPSNLGVIAEASEEIDGLEETNGHMDGLGVPDPDRRLSLDSNPITVETPQDLFFAFLAQLGPPTKSLVYTLKQILDELPWESHDEPKFRWLQWLGFQPMAEVAVKENLRSSLKQAIELYKTSRKEALAKLYQIRATTTAVASQQGGKSGAFNMQRAAQSNAPSSPLPDTKRTTLSQSQDVIVDIEEVSACCGHFSFSLLDFAEEMLTYLDVLKELKTEMENSNRSWTWLFPYRRRHAHRAPETQSIKRAGSSRDVDGYDAAHGIPEPVRRADDFANVRNAPRQQPWTRRIYKASRIICRDDVRFAVKVGIGAVLYALPAFIAETRPFFARWRGEWGLVSYMAVCCMTIGTEIVPRTLSFDAHSR